MTAHDESMTVVARRRGMGLSGRILLLASAFVMLAEVLIYVPSLASFRNNWLSDRLASAGTASLVFQAGQDADLPEMLQQEVLESIRAESIALKIKGTRRLIAMADMPPPVDRTFDLRERGPLRSIVESFDTLLFGGNRMLNVVGGAPMGGEFVEVVLREQPLRDAMLRYTANILLISLTISAITAMLLFMALRHLIVRPVQRLTGSILSFAANPEDATRLHEPSGRTDEIGAAEQALVGMQRTLARELKQREHLAALGLAVSKISHDLRNLLASAQLFSDRLNEIEDPRARRFVPKLIQALDRAITFCETSLAYGRVSERAPVLRRLRLHDVAEDVRETLGLDDDHAVRWRNEVPRDLIVEADPEHLFRILLNLCRNAVQAMTQEVPRGGEDAPALVLTIAAADTPAGITIDVGDTGPGVPERIKPRLFEAFRGGGRPGGTGLGLAIAAELVRGQGGTIRLGERPGPGACFRVVFPNRATRPPALAAPAMPETSPVPGQRV